MAPSILADMNKPQEIVAHKYHCGKSTMDYYIDRQCVHCKRVVCFMCSQFQSEGLHVYCIYCWKNPSVFKSNPIHNEATNHYKRQRLSDYLKATDYFGIANQLLTA